MPELVKASETAGPTYIQESQIWMWLEATCRDLGLKREADEYAHMRSLS